MSAGSLTSSPKAVCLTPIRTAAEVHGLLDGFRDMLQDLWLMGHMTTNLRRSRLVLTLSGN